MEPGGPSWTVIVFGLLLVLLAELFRHGADSPKSRTYGLMAIEIRLDHMLLERKIP